MRLSAPVFIDPAPNRARSIHLRGWPPRSWLNAALRFRCWFEPTPAAADAVRSRQCRKSSTKSPARRVRWTEGKTENFRRAIGDGDERQQKPHAPWRAAAVLVQTNIDASGLLQPRPFIHAFVWLIAIPLVLVGAIQLWPGERRVAFGRQRHSGFFRCPRRSSSCSSSWLPSCRGSAKRGLPR